MSSKGCSKRVCRNDYLIDIESRTREENFNRLKSVFEIKRPNKSPNITLRKAKGGPILNTTHNSDDEGNTLGKDKTFIRNSNSRVSSRINKYKRNYRKNSMELNFKEKDDKMKSVSDDIAKSNKAVKEFILQLETQTDSEDIDVRLNNDHLQTFSNLNDRLYDVNQIENDITYSAEQPTKNSEDGESKCNENGVELDHIVSNISTSLQDGLTQKYIKKSRKSIKSFKDAEIQGETETYRKSLVLEMDLEVAKMKLDGFIDDEDTLQNTSIDSDDEVFHTIKAINRISVRQYKQLFEGVFNDFDKDMEILQNEYVSKNNVILVNAEDVAEKHNESNKLDPCECQKEEINIEDEPEYEEKIDATEHKEAAKLDNSEDHIYNNVEYKSDIQCDCACSQESTYTQDDTDPIIQVNTFNYEDEFCESLGDDLENGSYFVEAYNAYGRELVIVEISLERRTVSLDKPLSLELKKSIKDSDMVFHEKDDKSLNVIDDPKHFVQENTELISSGFSNDPDSNRSTVYSTTSRDSEIFDDDDEGISLGNIEQRSCLDDNAYNNVRRETFCDDKGIVRIERVGYPEIASGSPFDDESGLQSPVSRNNSLTQRGKLFYIIEEIKSTEKKYVDDLKKVVTKYMPYIGRRTPQSLLGKQGYIFGNIETIFDNQRQFLVALENCGEEVDDVAGTFIEYEHLFELYPNYFKNKPRADIVLREFSPLIKQAQEKFKERLDLSSYLLTPLQRLGKYKLLLENIEKQLQKLELPTEKTVIALGIIKREMSKGNDFVAIESIVDSNINKSEYGSFKMREKFTVIKPRRFEAMVFLFENVVVFGMCEHKNLELYTYIHSIKMTDLRIATFEDLTIHLTDFTKAKKISRSERYTYVLEAKTPKIKDSWRSAIEDILWGQLFKVKENTLKMYQSNGLKRSKTSRNRIKSTGSSTFYID